MAGNFLAQRTFVMNKSEILKSIEESLLNTTEARNRMGCSENWYNPFYCIGTTFSVDELEEMPEKELLDLLRLADNVTDALY